MTEPSAQDAERQQFYAALESQQMGPLWAVLGRTLTAQPPRREVPHLWSWRNEPVMWLDGLDIPLLLSLQCMFFEEFTGATQPVVMPPRRSERLHGRCLMPGGGAGESTTPALPYSPIWRYAWSDARDALECLRRSSPADPCDGHILRYANPATGGEVLPTLGCRLQFLERGTHTQAHRHTASFVYHVAEGRGYSLLDGVRFDWDRGDTFAVPIWCWHEHVAPDEDAVLFSLTDLPVLRAIGQERVEVRT